MPGPVAAALIGAGSALVSNIWNAREARKNRDFQERMSSTAHTREVADLRRAGVNPMVRAMSGASSPSGDRAEMSDVGQAGLSSALQAKQVRAQIQLLESQSKTEFFEGMLKQQDLLDRKGGDGAAPGALLDLNVKRLNHDQLVKLLPLALEQAKAEIQRTSSSAEAASASAELDRIAATGAKLNEQFLKEMGSAGPMVRFFLEVLRGIRR